MEPKLLEEEDTNRVLATGYSGPESSVAEPEKVVPHEGGCECECDSDLSEVETELIGESFIISRNEGIDDTRPQDTCNAAAESGTSFTFEECLQKERQIRREASFESNSEGLSLDSKKFLTTRILSKLETLKAIMHRGQNEGMDACHAVSRSFVQHSNEFMNSVDTTNTKAVRNVINRFGDFIAVGDSNGNVLVVQTSSQKGQLLKHTQASSDVGGVTTLELVPYGKSTLLFSGHISGVINIWERRHNQQWSHCKEISGCHAATITSLRVVHVGMSIWLLSADSHGRVLSHNVQRFLSITAQALAGISRQLTGQATSASYLNAVQLDGIDDIGVVLSMRGPCFTICESLHDSTSIPCPYLIFCTEKGVFLAEVGLNGKVEARSVLEGFDEKNGISSRIYSAGWRRLARHTSFDTILIAISSLNEVNTYICKIPRPFKPSEEEVPCHVEHLKCLKCPGTVQGVTFVGDEGILVCVYFESESGKTRMALIRAEQYMFGTEDLQVESHKKIECIDTYDWIIPQPIDQLFAGELVWHGSLVGGPDIILLTSSGIRCTQLLSWQQKLGLMVSLKRYEDALLHAARLYCSLQVDDAMPDTGDWRANIAEPHDLPAISKQLVSLTIMYTQQALDEYKEVYGSTGHKALERETICDVVQLAFDVFLLLDRLEIFYQDIATILKDDTDPSSWEIFLEVLENTIRERIYSPKLPPDMIRMLVENLISRSETKGIEQLLLNFQISSLDLNQIIPLCIKHNLYSVILYVFSQGLKDYKTPAALLFSAAVKEYKSSKGNSLAMKLLVYIFACFQGFEYPFGDDCKVSDYQHTMRLEVMDFLLFSSLEQIVEVVQLWESVANFHDECKWDTYCKCYSKQPVLDFLCDIDASKTLELIQDLLSKWDALEQDIIQHRGDSKDDDQVCLRSLTQVIVDKLIDTLDFDSKPFDEVRVAKIEFILHHITSDRASLPSEAAVSVLSYLSHASRLNDSAFVASQKSFESIIDHMDDFGITQKIMDMARLAGFSAAEAKIHFKRGHYFKGMECLLHSKKDQHDSFLYYRNVLTEQNITKESKLNFQKATLTLFPKLVEIDPDSTAGLALDFLGEQQEEILSTFDPESNGFFLFLQSLTSKLKEQSGMDDQGFDHMVRK